MLRLSTILFMVFISPVTISYADPTPRTINVSGQGKAASPPDMATIHTGVVTQSVDASSALQQNNTAMVNILEVLKSNNIAAKDIQTSNFNVQPQYQRDRQARNVSEITGYQVTNQVTAHVRNLADLGTVLDALVKAGSNRLSGISFGIDDSTGVLNQARNRAISDARSRANLYAQAAGVAVGKVLTISEQPVQVPRPGFMPRAMAAEASSVPIATGQQEFQVTVHVVYEIVDE